MICNSCGTETKADICPHCGASMRGDVIAYSIPAPNEPKVAKEMPAPPKRKPPLRMKMVIWPAIALFLPLAYLFFDCFILLSEQLFFGTPSGSVYLLELMQCLSDVSFATNSLGELTEATFGNAVTLITHVSPVSILPAIAAGNNDLLPLLLPVVITVLLALGCAACGVLLILTGGRILRLRLYRDLTLFAGAGATFAPLLGNLLLRVIYCMGQGMDGADLMMRRVLPSLESLCVMGILVCALLPAMGTLRQLGAYTERTQDHVGFPFRLLAHAPFKLQKAMLILFSLLSLGVIALVAFLPMTNLGITLRTSETKQGIAAAWNGSVTALTPLGGGSPAPLALTRDLPLLAAYLGLGLLLLGVLSAVVSLLCIVFVKKEASIGKKGFFRALGDLADHLRSALLSPYGCMVVLQLVQVLMWLFFTPVAAHIDFSGAESTVTLIYLAMGQARLTGATTTLYSLMAAAGAVLWYSTAQCARVLRNRIAPSFEEKR